MCGWFGKDSEVQSQKRVEKHAVTIMLAACVALSALTAHLGTWGSNAFKIPVARFLETTGLISVDGYRELASMCQEAGKYDCTQKSYIRIFEKTKAPAELLPLASLQLALKETDKAAATYKRYFGNGGKDGTAMLSYAIILESKNSNKEALKYFNSSIKARPDVVPVRATAGIARILVKQKKFREAKDRIVSFQQSSALAAGYLTAELDRVERLSPNVIRRSIASQR